MHECYGEGGGWEGELKTTGLDVCVHKIHAGHVWVIDYLPPQLHLGFASATHGLQLVIL